MTFVIAQITDDDGALSLMADTKVTIAHDERAPRQIYTRPCQKIVILDDNLVAGFAGDTPDTALRHLVGLREYQGSSSLIGTQSREQAFHRALRRPQQDDAHGRMTGTLCVRTVRRLRNCSEYGWGAQDDDKTCTDSAGCS